MKYVILNLDDKPDNNGENFKDCKIIQINKELPVLLYFRAESEFAIGTATISTDDDGVYANIIFNTEDQIKLAMYDELAPCIGGITIERNENDDTHVTKIEIKSIGLDIFNTDSRIQSLKGQKNAQ